MTNTLEIVIKATNQFSDVFRAAASEVQGFADGVERTGRQIAGFGVGLTAALAPAALGFREATSSAIEFDTSITNIRSLTGDSTEEFAAMRNELLRLGSEAVAGPQAVAAAMYDIASGVADSSVHLAILESAIATSEAGASSLGGTTSALVSIMNSYGYEAEQAAYASDVLTRIVGMGVGTMDEFAAALPVVTGTAAQIDETFGELGAELAFMTTKGFSAGVAATQLRAAMSALLAPNVLMTDALKEIGYETGAAALESLGLVGVYQELMTATGGLDGNLAATVGSIDALQAVIQLTTDDFQAFNTTFQEGVDGATAAAQAIQRSGAAAQFEVLSAKLEALKIQVGDALLPAMLRLVEMVSPLIDRFAQWAADNPALVAQLGYLTAAGLALGGVLTVAGTALTMIAGAIGVLASPIGLVIVAVGALATAFASDLGGVRTLANAVIRDLRDRVGGVLELFQNFAASVREFGVGGAVLRALFSLNFALGGTVETAVRVASGIARAAMTARIWFDRLLGIARRAGRELSELFEEVLTFVTNVFQSSGMESFLEGIDLSKLVQVGQFLLGLLSPLGRVIDVLKVLGVEINLGEAFFALVDGLTAFFSVLNGGGTIFDALRDGFGGFIDDILVSLGVPQEFAQAMGTAFGNVVTFIESTVLPGLQALANWFTQDALPGVISFIRDTVLPGLQPLVDWFTRDALPGAVTFIEGTAVPAIQSMIDKIGGIWNEVSAFLQPIIDWFTVDLAGALGTTLNDHILPFVEDVIGDLGSIGGDLWAEIGPEVAQIFEWFTKTGLPAIGTFITETAIPAFNQLVDWFRALWNTIAKPIADFLTGVIDLGLNVIVGFISSDFSGAIDSLVSLFQQIWALVEGPVNSFRDGIRAVFEWLDTNAIQPFIATVQSIVTEFYRAVNAIRSFLGQGALPVPQIGGGATGGGTMALPPGMENPFFRALGGGVSAGRSYVVGDGGRPELFIPSSNGRIEPDVPMGDTYNIQVMLPAEALRDLATAQRMGQAFGDELIAELRKRGQR